MMLVGPRPAPPAHVHWSAKDSDCSDSSNGEVSDKSKFANLLCDLLSEHHRCVRKAAIFAQDEQHTCEARTLKMLAYIPSLSQERVKGSARDILAEEQKQIDTLQAHIQSTECPRQEFSQVTHPKVGLQPLCVAVPAEPDPNYCFPPHVEMTSPRICPTGVQHDQEASLAQQQVSLVKTEREQEPSQIAVSQVVIEDGAHEQNSNSGCDFENAASSEDFERRPSHHSVQFFETHKGSSGKISRSLSMASISADSSRSISSAMSRVLHSPHFELLAGSLIVINTFIMGAEMQYNGMKGGYATKYPTFETQAHEAWPHAAGIFVVLEQIFAAIFTLELLFRMAVLGRNWCKEALNWMDLVFVLISWLDVVYREAGVMDPMMARLVRLVRLSRGLRLAKLSRVTSSLHLLIKSVGASVSILSWSVGILLVAQCISGMMLCQLVHHFVMDESKDLVARQRVFAYYGTFSRSMITMFEVHLANFGPACRILLDYVGEEYAYLFLAYRCFAGFAIINVINAVFVQQTIKVAEADQDVMLNQKRKAVESYSKKVKAFFRLADVDGDGCLSVEELQAFEDNPTYQLWMSALDIEAADLRGLFRIIDTDDDGAISADELILGASRIKGPARSIDMVQVLAHLHKLDCKFDALVKAGTNSCAASTWQRQISTKSSASKRSMPLML